MRRWVTIRAKTVANITGLLCFFSFASSGLADPEGLRRFNESQNLDLKIRQQQSLRFQEQSIDRQQLQKRFDRQRSQQQILQSRQLRQIPKSRLPSATLKPKLKESVRGSSVERFKREQKSQELGFKLESAQPVDESESFEQNRRPPFQQFFEEN
jgi:hypothetical protein